MRRRAADPRIAGRCKGDERIFRSFLRRELFEQKALTQAIGGDHNLFEPRRLQQFFQNHCPERQRFGAPARHHFHLLERFARKPRNEARKLHRPGGGNRIVVEHTKSVILFLHVHARESPPHAANCVKRAPAEIAETRERRQSRFHKIARSIGLAARRIDEAQRTKGQRQSLACATVLHCHHVETAASQIGDQTIRRRNSRQHTLCSEPRLLFSGEDANGTAPGGFRIANKLLPIDSIACGSGGDCVPQFHTMRVGENSKTGKRIERESHAFVVEPAARDHIAADCTNGLLIVHDSRRAREGFINHQTDGI